MKSIIHDPQQNDLLAALPPEEFDRLAPHLELIEMSVGEVICEAGAKIRYVYFPTSAVISHLYLMEDGSCAETAVVGKDGIVGVSLFMGVEIALGQGMVQSAGYAYRLKSSQLMAEFNRAGGRRAGALRNLLLRYTRCLFRQMAQTAVCNRHHSLDQQLCRWLLLNIDLKESNELFVTQELIAYLFGVRRESITDAAGRLRQAGLIQYRRGRITIVDRAGLEDQACECYALVKEECERIMPRRKTTKQPLLFMAGERESI